MLNLEAESYGLHKGKFHLGIHWVGGNDRRLALFENMFPLPQGVAYNSYLILDDKVALMDTVDAAITGSFLRIWIVCWQGARLII